MVKALVLFSGGLDSLLAAEILRRQNIQITALIFQSYFFGPERAVQVARLNNFDYQVVNFSRRHLSMVKAPRYGYGRAANPCIDCHGLMFRRAVEIMRREQYDFIASGEVLGQRPMSQNRHALALVAELSGASDFLLRPLSAGLLPPTKPELSGLVDRRQLLSIRGRSRRLQLSLAKQYGLQGYNSPAGGCLLTEKVFGQRLKELFNHRPDCDGNDVELLKYGRHFWQEQVKIVVGRDELENKQIEKLCRPGDILVIMSNYNGPSTLLRNYGQGKITTPAIKRAQQLTQYYSTKARRQKDVRFSLRVDKK